MNTLKTINLCFENKIFYKDSIITSDKVTFITGVSGSGKSTLLKLLSFNTLASQGEIHYNDQNITELIPSDYRRRVTLALQDVFLFPGTICDNFKQYYMYRDEKCPNDNTIANFLKICVLDLPLDKDVSEMSGGEKQRLYISIILSFNPKFLFLDEPTSALDTDNAFLLIQNIIMYCHEHMIGLVIVSHDASLVEKYAEMVIDLGGDHLE